MSLTSAEITERAGSVLRILAAHLGEVLEQLGIDVEDLAHEVSRGHGGR